MAGLPVAREAQDDSVLERVRAALGLGQDVVDVDVAAGELVADAAAPARADESFFFDGGWKGYISPSLFDCMAVPCTLSRVSPVARQRDYGWRRRGSLLGLVIAPDVAWLHVVPRYDWSLTGQLTHCKETTIDR